ncbi:hypothetical protein EVG20_g834 [Dentipellis fragilis]|uniref:F-box domain-containing protein n=1 Tax=Dentipellis fragilis TaxID=205917 RepID=A0A4Y9ZDW5_9AGAM|nr:hypothetical protein EVG20_g834 [Dentipellis fragilis]
MRAPDLADRTAVDDDDHCMIDGDLSDLSDVDSSDLSSVESEPGDDGELVENEEELSESSDSDDDFGEGKKATRPSKRRKTIAASTKATNTKKRPSRKIQGRLRDMLAMPLDILYEPASRLSDRQFQNAAADMCEPSWANLLFGGAICFNCGTKGIQRIDFYLRMRLCVKCRKDNLVYEAKFEEKCPDTDLDVVELLEYTHTGGWSHGHASSKKFYWKPSVDKMDAKLTELKKAVAMNMPNARKVLEDFRKERLLHKVFSSLQNRFVFEHWVRVAAEWRSQNEDDSRLNEIRRRLAALGYDEQDMNTHGFKTLKEVRAKAQITDRIWTRIQSTLEEYVIKARESRLAARRRSVRWGRQTEAQRCVEHHTQNILPMQRLYLPPVEATSNFSCFKPLFDRDVSFTITAAEWQAAAADLPACLMQWMHEIREKYTAMLPEGYRIASTAMQLVTMPANAAARSAMTHFAGPLELAVSVFVGNPGRWFIGRDIFCAIQEPSYPQDLKFSERGSAAAAAVASSAGKIPNQVTASELDAHDLRFFCTDCYERNGGVAHGLHAYSWRACIRLVFGILQVDHYAQSLDHPAPRWMRLSAEDIINVKKKEPKIRSFYTNQWSCNHCTATPFATDRPRDPVMIHIRTAHSISDPVENQDFFYRPRVLSLTSTFPPPTVLIPRLPPKVTPQFSCLHCPASPRPRLFIISGVTSHLRAKHKVLEPKANTDFLDTSVPQSAQVPTGALPANLPLASGHGLPTKPPFHLSFIRSERMLDLSLKFVVAFLLDNTPYRFNCYIIIYLCTAQACPGRVVGAVTRDSCRHDRQADSETRLRSELRGATLIMRRRGGSDNPDRLQGSDSVQAQRTSNKRPAEKVRKSKDEQAVNRSEDRVHRRRPDSNFVHLPLDVLYEISCLLSPGDLLQLARTAKNLRALLMSRKSSFVWKAAREGTPGPAPIPEPFEGMSEPSWAHLLFGEPICDAKDVDVVTFEFKRRLCESCLKKGYEAEILDIAPWINAEEAGRVRRGNPDQWYWKEDLLSVNKYIKRFKAKERKSADFQSKLRDWVTSETAKLDAFHEKCAELRDWEEESDAWHEAEEEAAHAKKVSEIQRRLQALGHDSLDVLNPRLLKHPLVSSRELLTDACWDGIAPQLEKALAQLKNKRFYKDRVEHLHQLYEAYKETILPIQTLYLPRADTVCQFPHIKALLHRDASDYVTNEQWDQAIEALPTHLTDWMHTKKDMYAAMLPPDNYAPSEPMRLVSLDSPSSDLDSARRDLVSGFAGPLELAIAVFKETQISKLIYEDGTPKTRIGRDFCSFWDDPKGDGYDFFLLGSQTAAALVRLVGKDPLTTTAMEMDVVDERFYCSDCWLRDMSSVISHPWRPAVEHAKKHEGLPEWHVMTSEIIAYDEMDDVDGARAWAEWRCNHCVPEDETCRETKFSIAQHVELEHDILDPVNGQDFYYHTSLRRAHPSDPIVNSWDYRSYGDAHQISALTCRIRLELKPPLHAPCRNLHLSSGAVLYSLHPKNSRVLRSRGALRPPIEEFQISKSAAAGHEPAACRNMVWPHLGLTLSSWQVPNTHHSILHIVLIHLPNLVEAMNIPGPPILDRWSVTGAHLEMSSTGVDGGYHRTLAVKRRKTSESNSEALSMHKHRGSRKNDGRLKVMLEMPLDVLYEVFSHLAPADLIQLTRTSKSLRLLLLSRKSNFIWRSVRTQVPGPAVPNPPEDMSEPSWANLIFGGPFCSNCGRKGSLIIPAASHHAGLSTASRCGDRTIGKKYYWIRDLCDMHNRLMEESNRSSLADGVICKYYEKEARASREIVTSARHFEEWVKDGSLWRIENAMTMRLTRINEIKQRCLAMGFDSIDLESIGFLMLPGVRSERPLTTKDLSRDELEALPCVQNLMRKDPREDIPVSLWDEAAQRFFMEWVTPIRDKFIAMLPPGNYEAAQPMKFISMNASATELQAARKGLGSFAGPLELAISVFVSDTNGRRNILIGRDLCNAWKGIKGVDIPVGLDFKFYPDGSNTAARTVALAGMDPEKTTTSAMDEKVLFFRCNECGFDRDGGWWVHSWRYWASDDFTLGFASWLTPP